MQQHPQEGTMPTEKQMEELSKLLADYVAEPSAEFVSIAVGFLVVLLLMAHLSQSDHYTPSDLVLPQTRLAIGRLSPSFSFFQRLLAGGIRLEAMHWREFEELVADLLQKDGYTVDLGPGRNDGGKDIIAVKEVEGAGLFMTIWQAKKMQPSNKVGIEVIRELADTRNEHKASKGIIVTTTYLTRGALERVQRDQYLLGKVDRDDLLTWIQRVKDR
jgi:HJR/Mrr/RecB family endonuclease